jgi:hypothetical protein
LHRAAIYEDGDGHQEPRRRNYYKPPVKSITCGTLEWRVSTRASSVCDVLGRCVLADIVEKRPAKD